MSLFQERDACVIQLPAKLVGKLRSPQGIILRFIQGKSIDVGKFCFRERSSESRKKERGSNVKLTSFDQDRIAQVAKLIKQINADFLQSGLRPETLFTNYKIFSRFLDWCDENGHHKVLAKEEAARSAIFQKQMHFKRLIDQHQMGINTAAVRENAIIAILERFYLNEKLCKGMNRLETSRWASVPVSVPSDDSQEHVFTLCVTVFNGLSDLVLNWGQDGTDGKFPFALTVPQYLERRENRMWLFPTVTWCDHPNLVHYSAYNFDEGRIFSFDEMKRHYSSRPNTAIRKAISSANEIISKGNADPYHYSRIHFGIFAMAAFRLIFLAITGINEAQATSLPWNEELEESIADPSVERQGFRAIKYRAMGRLVVFEVGVRYMPLLKRFMQLRKYFLRDTGCERLFFVWDVRKKMARQGRENEQISMLYRTLHRIDPCLPTLRSRAWRAAKQDHLIRSTTPTLTAWLMQHSTSTTLRAYSNGSEVVQQKEMSAYFNRVEELVLAKRRVPSEQRRAIGSCIQHGAPVPLAANVPATPNCVNAEGCLFCDKYRVHIDEIDARKIISARHCIQIVVRNSADAWESELAARGVLDRLNGILSEFKKQNPRMIEKVEAEVDEFGELDAFWSAKVETLMALGMETL